MGKFFKYTLLALLFTLLFVILIADIFSLPTFLVFLILKLTGKIAWGWFFVCLPAIIFIISITLTKFIRVFAKAYRETINE